MHDKNEKKRKKRDVDDDDDDSLSKERKKSNSYYFFKKHEKFTICQKYRRKRSQLATEVNNNDWTCKSTPQDIDFLRSFSLSTEKKNLCWLQNVILGIFNSILFDFY